MLPALACFFFPTQVHTHFCLHHQVWRTFKPACQTRCRHMPTYHCLSIVALYLVFVLFLILPALHLNLTKKWVDNFELRHTQTDCRRQTDMQPFRRTAQGCHNRHQVQTSDNIPDSKQRFARITWTRRTKNTTLSCAFQRDRERVREIFFVSFKNNPTK